MSPFGIILRAHDLAVPSLSRADWKLPLALLVKGRSGGASRALGECSEAFELLRQGQCQPRGSQPG